MRSLVAPSHFVVQAISPAQQLLERRFGESPRHAADDRLRNRQIVARCPLASYGPETAHCWKSPTHILGKIVRGCAVRQRFVTLAIGPRTRCSDEWRVCDGRLAALEHEGVHALNHVRTVVTDRVAEYQGKLHIRDAVVHSPRRVSYCSLPVILPVFV